MVNRLDSSTYEIIGEHLEEAVDPIDQALAWGRGAPGGWRSFTIGQAVRRMRLRLGLTQNQLGLLSGLSRPQIVKLERGKDPTLSTLRQVFAGLGCELVLLPASRLTASALRRRTFDLEETSRIPRRWRG